MALASHLLSLIVVRMLWWFLILGVCATVVVSVALRLYMRVRIQLKHAAAHRAEVELEPEQMSPPKN